MILPVIMSLSRRSLATILVWVEGSSDFRASGLVMLRMLTPLLGKNMRSNSMLFCIQFC